MVNLEALILFLFLIQIDSDYIDGIQLHSDILIYLPRLKKFTFSIHTGVIMERIKIHLSSNEDIQNSFIGRGYGQVGSYVCTQPLKSMSHCTRIHVYKFRASVGNENGDTFVLKNEIFKELKPADQEVSRFKHRSTPLVLCATAGLRLLSETKQKPLLESVSNTFKKYGFYRPKMDIAIMNETEEGIDAWLTFVYLKGEQFYGSRIAALDLGDEEIIMKYMHQFRMFRRDIKLCSRSYLGYGLMIARQTIFINQTNVKN
ncbi:unnamed protein product [Rotaria sordida]|uniref:Uncharacterized protein n=2 Tax=Rotaria sordida TaxID=392033 RepID=A0A815ZYD0_9BILA|nr:unnamed protein product [Rotaria sordida]